MLVAVLLAFAGGYLDTYTWITHGVLANAETTLTLSVPVFVLLLVLLVCSLARPIEASEQF
ncbi:hypothetical protein [Bradyrhizobium lablabi]|uniref:hypothetical protein n=1 Tax=Bradyrhizobium lablabi TaxID=722472 RepID=UPI0032DEC76E